MKDKTVGDEIVELFNMDEFKPVCRRCQKNIVYGQGMGESTGVGGTYFYHEFSADCGILESWIKPLDEKPHE